LVLSAKVFEVREKVGIDVIAAKLKDVKREEPYVEASFKCDLITEVKDLKLTTDHLTGVFSQDRVIHINHRGELLTVPKTFETPFLFQKYKEKTHLTILQKKWQANNIANYMSEALFITTGLITEVEISPDNLRLYHEQNPEGTKVIFFSDVNIPNVEKLSLYGASLANTKLYADFLSHGKIWYIVITSKKHGHTVGITSNGIIVIFNQVAQADFLSYITDEIFPLIS
jgi:hypothetical protein